MTAEQPKKRKGRPKGSKNKTVQDKIAGIKKTRAAWTDSYYLQAYLLARRGETDGQIAAAFGTNPVNFSRWKKERPALEEAIELARSDGDIPSFLDYVHERLPDHLKGVWEELCDPEVGLGRVRELLNGTGEKDRKRLFLHAYVNEGFVMSRALARCGLTKTQVARWSDDEEFSELLREMDTYKGDFFESALVDLVRLRNPQAVIHANKTYNRDRGYGEKTEVEHTGTVEHKHLVDVSQLDLPVDVLRQVLDAVRRLKERQEGAKALPAPAPSHFLPAPPVQEVIDP